MSGIVTRVLSSNQAVGGEWPWPNVTIHEPVVLLHPGQLDIGPETRIDSFVKIEGGQGVTIGRRVHIASFCHLNAGGGLLVIEDEASLSSSVCIATGQATICPQVPGWEKSVVRGQVIVRRGAHLYTRVTVVKGVEIGEGALVGAGAVVTKNVPAWEIWAGVPARKIGEREDRP
jgi:galactoside O-acetyltransferase